MQTTCRFAKKKLWSSTNGSNFKPFAGETDPSRQLIRSLKAEVDRQIYPKKTGCFGSSKRSRQSSSSPRLSGHGLWFQQPTGIQKITRKDIKQIISRGCKFAVYKVCFLNAFSKLHMFTKSNGHGSTKHKLDVLDMVDTVSWSSLGSETSFLRSKGPLNLF